MSLLDENDFSFSTNETLAPTRLVLVPTELEATGGVLSIESHWIRETTSYVDSVAKIEVDEEASADMDLLMTQYFAKLEEEPL